MRITTAVVFFLPALASAFAPVTKPLSSPHCLTRLTESAALVPEPEALNDLAGKISNKVEQVMEKADDLVLKNVMRFVNHAPAIVTLGSLLNQLGSTKYGIDIAPSALSIAAPSGLGGRSFVDWILLARLGRDASSCHYPQLAHQQRGRKALARRYFRLGGE